MRNLCVPSPDAREYLQQSTVLPNHSPACRLLRGSMPDASMLLKFSAGVPWNSRRSGPTWLTEKEARACADSGLKHKESKQFESDDMRLLGFEKYIDSAV